MCDKAVIDTRNTIGIAIGGMFTNIRCNDIGCHHQCRPKSSQIGELLRAGELRRLTGKQNVAPIAHRLRVVHVQGLDVLERGTGRQGNSARKNNVNVREYG